MIRVLIADEHPLFRRAIRMALEEEPDVTVVAEAGDSLIAVTEAELARPQIALVGTNAPGFEGLRAARLIKDRMPECHVLVLAEDEVPEIMAEAFRSGASGYLSKASSADELIGAARLLAAGESVIPQGMLGPLLSCVFHRMPTESPDPPALLSRLSGLEKQVLTVLGQGANDQEIAAALGIDPGLLRLTSKRS